MNTLIDTPVSVRHKDGLILVAFASGGSFEFPCSSYPRLAQATPSQLADTELSPFGIHWPQLDEDLSIRGLLAEWEDN